MVGPTSHINSLPFSRAYISQIRHGHYRGDYMCIWISAVFIGSIGKRKTVIDDKRQDSSAQVTFQATTLFKLHTQKQVKQFLVSIEASTLYNLKFHHFFLWRLVFRAKRHTDGWQRNIQLFPLDIIHDLS